MATLFICVYERWRPSRSEFTACNRFQKKRFKKYEAQFETSFLSVSAAAVSSFSVPCSPLLTNVIFFDSVSLCLFFYDPPYVPAMQLITAALDISMYQFLYIEVDDARYLS